MHRTYFGPVLIVALLLHSLFSVASAVASHLQTPYSLGSILTLFEKREGRPLYLVAYNTIARARYAPEGQRLVLDIVMSPLNLNGGIREIRADDELVRTKMNMGFIASFIIVSCGSAFGDDPCDQYSPIGEPIKLGNQIGEDGKRKFESYLQAIGRVLSQR